MSSLAEKPYYKWIVAGLMGLLAFFAVGFSANIAGLYLKTVTEDLRIERGLYSLMNLFRFGACALLNASFAFLVGKLGAKRLSDASKSNSQILSGIKSICQILHGKQQAML